MKNKLSSACLSAAGLILAASPGLAEDGARSVRQESVKPEMPPASAPPAQQADPLRDLKPVADEALGELRGGETIVVGDQTLTAISRDNVLTGGYTAGAVSLSGNALAGFSGIGNFAINTGAQVSLQSGMNLTINVGQ